MPGKMREGSAAKAEAPQKIDDDQAEQPSVSDAAPPPRPRGQPANHTGPDRHPLRMSAKSDQQFGAGILLIGGRHLRLAGVVIP
jgi:hypothetical protein